MKKPIIFLLGAGSLPVSLALAQGHDEKKAASAAAIPAAVLDNPVVLILLALIAAVIVLAVVMRLIGASRRRNDEQFEHTYDGGYESVMPSPNKKKEPSLRPAVKAVADVPTDTVIAPWSVPADFDVPRFLRKAKAAFIRLQASWDQADLQDIRRFTTRELYGEFVKQLKERGNRADATEVVTVGAALQGVETVDDYHIATVQFSGLIKEALGAEAVPFSEVWKLSKPLDGHRNWVVTQIQQFS